MSRDTKQSYTFFHEDSKTFIDCDTESDPLIAPLAVKHVDLDLFDTHLRIANNPSFNLEDVTFESSGDLFAHEAEGRDEQVTRLVVSKAESRSTAMDPSLVQIPQVVVEHVISSFRDEITDVISNLLLWGGRNVHILQDEDTHRERMEIVRTLLSCSLVHSSWLLQARHAAGTFLQILCGSPMHFGDYTQNPCFGQWTRDLHLGFNSPLSSDINVDHLVTLFNRVPNIKVLALDFTSQTDHSDWDETVVHSMGEYVSRHLSQVEELSLSFAFRTSPLSILSKFLAFPGGFPSLKTLRLFGAGFKFVSCDPPCSPDCFEAVPNLEIIRIQLPIFGTSNDDFARTQGPVSISWMNSVECLKPKFVPSDLHYWIASASLGLEVAFSKPEKEALSMIKHLDLRSLDDRPGNLSTILKCCTSASSLVLSLPSNANIHKAYCDSALEGLTSMSDTMVDVRVYFGAHPTVARKEYFGNLDKFLEKVVVSFGTRKRKRPMEMHFDTGHNYWERDVHGKLCFPCFSAICTDKSVVYRIDIEAEESSVHAEIHLSF